MNKSVFAVISASTGPSLADMANNGSTMSASTPDASCTIVTPTGQTIQVPHGDPRKHDPKIHEHDPGGHHPPVVNPPPGGGHQPPVTTPNCPGKGHQHFGADSDPNPEHGCDS